MKVLQTSHKMRVAHFKCCMVVACSKASESFSSTQVSLEAILQKDPGRHVSYWNFQTAISKNVKCGKKKKKVSLERSEIW